MKKNGSAIDAAVASLFCTGVVNLHSTGIGGGGFLVYYNRTTKKSEVFDFRETAPAAASEKMFVPNNVSSTAGKRWLLYGMTGVAKHNALKSKTFGRSNFRTKFCPKVYLSEPWLFPKVFSSESFNSLKIEENKEAYHKMLINQCFASSA